MAVGTTAFPTALDTVVELVEAANNASTTLNGTLTSGATTITVTSTSLFPSSGLITIESEIISYTGTTSTTFTGCTRGVDGTSAASHADTTDVYGYYTSLHHEALRGAIIAVETKLGYGSSTSTANTVLLGNGTGTSAWGAITNAYIDASAAIAVSKLAAVTASRALVSDASGFLSASAVTSTELGYVSGVTSAIQTQLNAKQAAFSDQNANIVYAGPATGAAAAPAFRALVAADIPDISSTYLTVATAASTYLTTATAASTYQPLDTDLTAIAALSPTDDDIIQRKTGAWTNRTMAQLKADLSLSASDVGLGNVENTALSTWAGSSNITTLGTVTTGTLSTGAVIGGVTMTLGSDGTGDIYYRSAGGVLTRLAAGTNGHVLTLSSGLPAWQAASGGGLTVGTTAIASGTAGRILYETSGNVLGEIAGSSVSSAGSITLAPSAVSGGAVGFQYTPGAHTAVTAEVNDFYIPAHTMTVTGAIATQRFTRFGIPTITAASSLTTTTAATVSIDGPPAAAGSAAITNKAALNIESGFIRVPQASGFPNGAPADGLTNGGSLSSVIAFPASAIAFAFSGYTTFSIDSAGHVKAGSSGQFVWTSGAFTVYTADTGLARAAAGVVRLTNSTTGAGKLIIGTSSASTTAADLYVVSSSASLTPFRVDSAASPSVPIFEVRVNGTADTALEVDGDSTAGNTRLLIYDVDNATLERVTVGAADSGGSGFKVLRIPN